MYRIALPFALSTFAVVFASHAGTSNDMRPGAGRSAFELGDEYHAVDSFIEFRRLLLAEGWSPVPGEDCLGELRGSYGGRSPGDETSLEAFCVRFPELDVLNAKSESGFVYAKESRQLYVYLSGDLRGLMDSGLRQPVVEGSASDGGYVARRRREWIR